MKNQEIELAPTPLYKIFKGEELRIAELIQRRRLQILVHACIYYGLNENLIPDSTYDKWECELVELQEKHPDIADKVVYANDFRNWNGSTGAFLPYGDLKIVNIARHLMENRNGV